MAASMAEKTVNGNYGAHQSYDPVENYPKAPAADTAQVPIQASEQEQTAPATAPSNSEEDKPIPKEMIGWYFVEQYYNTMSKDPGKLYLFYTKKSQFVAGNEAEKVNVAVGQRSISEKIKELAIQDCKVRVTNVDSQESAKSILVQVIGEMSNQAAPHRKFVQTFVLAEQPTGYYVLNDIFRYIVDEEEQEEEEEEEEEEQATNGSRGAQAPKNEPKSTTVPDERPDDALQQQQQDLDTVDQKLKTDVLHESARQPPSESVPTGATESNQASATQTQDDPTTDDVDENEAPTSADVDEPTRAAESASKEELVQPEKPQDPDPTPIGSPPKASKAPVSEPPAAPKPAAPKTWANLVASKGSGTTPANSAAKLAPPATPSTLKPRTTNASTKENVVPAASSSSNEEGLAKTQLNGNNGWQTAGVEKQRQARPHSQSISSNTENTLGYVKNVTEKVDGYLLRTKLAEFGELKYFDVSRQKNCAFVEFAEPPAYNACVAANPHDIGGEQVFVEERRPRANAFGGNFNNRGGARGGRPGPNDRPGSQSRGGFGKDGGRGGYPPRGGRGGAMTPRARGGQAQPA